MGVWITVVVGAAAAVGAPDHLPMMALLGGGGFLVAAVVSFRGGATA